MAERRKKTHNNVGTTQQGCCRNDGLDSEHYRTLRFGALLAQTYDYFHDPLTTISGRCTCCTYRYVSTVKLFAIGYSSRTSESTTSFRVWRHISNSSFVMSHPTTWFAVACIRGSRKYFTEWTSSYGLFFCRKSSETPSTETITEPTHVNGGALNLVRYQGGAQGYDFVFRSWPATPPFKNLALHQHVLLFPTNRASRGAVRA